MELNSPPHICEALTWVLEDPTTNIVYNPQWREYQVLTTALPPDDPDFIPRKLGDERISLAFCPFDGTQLPTSLRDQWVAKVLALGLDPGCADLADLPEELRDARWWALKTQS